MVDLNCVEVSATVQSPLSGHVTLCTWPCQLILQLTGYSYGPSVRILKLVPGYCMYVYNQMLYDTFIAYSIMKGHCTVSHNCQPHIVILFCTHGLMLVEGVYYNSCDAIQSEQLLHRCIRSLCALVTIMFQEVRICFFMSEGFYMARLLHFND